VPKEVDHEQRRNELADAVIRVVAAGGVGSVTMSRVAEESGWSTGVLNHYYEGKRDLLVGALKRALHLIVMRMQESSTDADVVTALAGMLVQLLPVDETRVGFARVWLSFCGEALMIDDIRKYLASGDESWRGEISQVIRRGQADGVFAADCDPDWAADALAALVDGLSTRVIMRDESMTIPAADRTVREWIAALVMTRGAPPVSRPGRKNGRSVDAPTRSASRVAAR